MEGAIPQTLYARSEEHIDAEMLCDPGKPMTWGELSLALGVPVFVCPAPASKDGYLVLVRMSAVKDADSTREEKVLRGRGKTLRRGEEEKGSGGEEEKRSGGVEEMEDEEEEDDLQVSSSPSLQVFDLPRWRRVLAALMITKDAVMQDALWKPLVGLQWEALAMVLPPDIYASMMGEMNADESTNRRGLRWCYLALLALALESGAEMEAEIAEIEGKMGIN
jgi:hypothetical protein